MITTLVLLVVALIVAVVVGGALFPPLVVWLTGARRGHIDSARSARLARMGQLSARLSASFVGARVRRLFAGPERRQRIDAERRRRDAERVASTMGEMKGAFMKLGQMLSFVSDDVPEEMRLALASLQAQAPPMDFPLLRDVAERELAAPLERAFARFDAAPLASASIGQVHRAQLPTGEEVAVKIQYPGVAAAIRADLDNAAVLGRLLGAINPGVETGPVVAELRARVLEELDYAREADNQRRFADLYAGHPFFAVPAVHGSHSTAHVLTTSLARGLRYDEACALDEPARQRYAEILYRFVVGSVMGHGVFNGDPHPGNYLFDGGRVVFLDFGCVKYFPPEVVAGWRAMLLAHMAGDRAGFRRRLVTLGFVRPDSPLDDDALYDFFQYFYEPFHSDRVFTYTREYTARSFHLIFRPEGAMAQVAKSVNMPPDFVFANRIQWGVHSLLSRLGATNNWHRIHREYLEGAPPSTELGRLEREWRDAQPGSERSRTAV